MDSKTALEAKRGRTGIAFVIIGFVFMSYGATNIIAQPTPEEEEEILN